MARSYATVGQMTTYAVDRAVSSPDLASHPDHTAHVELLLRHMLEFVLMAPRSREAFLRTIARSERDTGTIVSDPRPRRSSPDLVADLLHTPGAAEDAARLGVSVRVDRPLSSRALRRALDALGPDPQDLLVCLVRTHDADAQRRAAAELSEGAGSTDGTGPTEDTDEAAAPTVVVATWNRIAKKLAKADPGHADLWETIGEIGENAGSPVVQYPLDARKLLTTRSVAEELHGHLELLRRASRELLNTSPRFSTRRGQEGAHLQAGVTRARAGLELGEADRGTLVHARRGHETPLPLWLGTLDSPTEHRRAEDWLDALAATSGWREDPSRLPEPDELIGAPVSPAAEGARRLLWALFHPTLLHERGFDLAPARRQRPLSATTLSLRLVQTGGDPDVLYRIWVGGTAQWATLVPRVTREATAELAPETYAVAPRKGQSTSDFVWEVHRALRSLTIPLRD